MSSTFLHPKILSAGAICWIVGCAVFACRREQAQVLPGDAEIVARVNGAVITRYDVERTGKRSLGELAAGSIERVAYPQLVQAAIQSKAIALAAERELDPVQRATLEKEVAAFREELLVRRYLEAHGPPKPITQEMAADYYQRYPERFGKKTEVSYEIVGSTRTLDPSERAALLRAVERAADQSDWRGWAAALAAEGQPVTYTRTSASDRLIHPKLREFLEGLKPERSSPPAFVQGRVYVARVVGKTEHPARPFEEVQRDIERLLGPAQVSAAIERAARDVMKTTEVELVDAPRPPERGSLARKTEGKQP